MKINQGTPCHSSNYSSRNGSDISYIVIHFTSNNGDTAQNNCTYFSGADRQASAHYFVGDDGIYQSVADNSKAWHCGGTSVYKHKYCRNANSIGIEMCSRINSNGEYYIKDSVTDNTIQLTRYLMNKYKIPSENVIRHYDVWGKNCPEPFVKHPEQWNNFKKRLSESEDEEMTQEEKNRINAMDDSLTNLYSIVKQIREENAELKAIVNKLANPMIFNYVDDNMPIDLRPTIEKLIRKGYLQGEEEGKLNLNYDMLRMLAINDRAKIYGE